MDILYNAYIMKSFDTIINKKKRLTFTFNQYMEQERMFIETAVSEYLKSIGMEDFSNKLCYCIHEQANNACKANSKRIYFLEQNLDINNTVDYKNGIKNFKKSIVQKKDHYFALRKKGKMFIKFQIKRDDQYLYISIINNVPLTDEELVKINDKFEISRHYDNMMEAFEQLEDIQEGAGLGIFTMLMLYKEMGIKPEDINIFKTKYETHATTKIKYA
jgi:hypothetical protein